MSKEEYRSDAEKLFVRQGKKLGEIAEALNVSAQTLSRWKKAGDWANKRRSYLLSTSGKLQKLDEMILQLIENQKKPDASFADSLFKLTLAKERIKGTRDVLYEALEMMDAFTRFVVREEKDGSKTDWLRKQVRAYLDSVKEKT